MTKFINRLVYLSQQYGRYPETFLADSLIVAYLLLLLFGNMNELTLVSGVALLAYVYHAYKQIL